MHEKGTKDQATVTSVYRYRMTITTTKDKIMSANATNDMTMMVPRLAGNLPCKIHSWAWKYLLQPSSKVTMLMPRNVAPNGRPIFCSFVWSNSVADAEPLVWRRNSCVTATPMDAKAREVLSHARNVRSEKEL